MKISSAKKSLGCRDTYQVNPHRPAVEPPSLSRKEAGLPDTGFVFCCFNNVYKLNPDMFDVWMRVLTRTPQKRALARAGQ